MLLQIFDYLLFIYFFYKIKSTFSFLFNYVFRAYSGFIRTVQLIENIYL